MFRASTGLIRRRLEISNVRVVVSGDGCCWLTNHGSKPELTEEIASRSANRANCGAPWVTPTERVQQLPGRESRCQKPNCPTPTGFH